jgi:hypothetical protein
MGDFITDKNQLSEKKTSIFDSFKFRGHRRKHGNSLSEDIDKSPTITIEEDTSTNHTPNEKWVVESNPSSVRLHETISGNFIITRGWDGNNMLVYKMRRKN